MESKAKLFGRPVHPMLIVFPLGLLATAVIFDLITWVRDEPRWTEMAFYLIGVGIVGGLLAAVFGLVDWRAIPSGTRAKSIGAVHGGGNVIVLILFAASWLLRYDAPTAPPNAALALSYAGVLLALFTSWLGGELVDRLGVGVDDGAHLDAPSSISVPHVPQHEPGFRRP
jgi:uncharacterized membrane protein